MKENAFGNVVENGENLGYQLDKKCTKFFTNQISTCVLKHILQPVQKSTCKAVSEFNTLQVTMILKETLIFRHTFIK